MNQPKKGNLNESIGALALLLGGIAGIYVGMETLRKLAEKHLNPLLDKLNGDKNKLKQTLKSHSLELKKAAKQGKDTLEKKLVDIINNINESPNDNLHNIIKEVLQENKKKRDRCLRIADRKFNKPSAYKSGAVVRCRKGNIWKGLKEDESLHKWFKRQGPSGKEGGWVDCNSPDGKGGYKACGRKKGEKRAKYPSCRPTPSKCKDPGKGKKWGKTK